MVIDWIFICQLCLSHILYFYLNLSHCCKFVLKNLFAVIQSSQAGRPNNLQIFFIADRLFYFLHSQFNRDTTSEVIFLNSLHTCCVSFIQQWWTVSIVRSEREISITLAHTAMFCNACQLLQSVTKSRFEDVINDVVAI